MHGPQGGPFGAPHGNMPAPFAFRQLQQPQQHQFAPPPQPQQLQPHPHQFNQPPPPPSPFHQQPQHPQQFGAAPVGYSPTILPGTTPPHMMLMQQPIHHQPPQTPGHYPPPPPPSRQLSAFELPPQVSGPGSLLGASSAAEPPPQVAVGMILSPFTVLDQEPSDKRFGGEEHAATTCTEFSSIPRGPNEQSPVGRWIVHQGDLTLFALKQGLFRVVYQKRGEEDKQMEVCGKDKHTAPVVEMTFLAREPASPNMQSAVTVSKNEMILWRFDTSSGRCVITMVSTLANGANGASRLRAHPISPSRIVQFSSSNGCEVINDAFGDASKTAIHGDVRDVAWTTDGAELLFVTSDQLYRWSVAGGSSSPVGCISNASRLLSLTGCAHTVLIACDDFTKILLWNVRSNQASSSVEFKSTPFRYTGVEVDPSGSYVLIAYRRKEPTGESSDQGFFVLHIADRSDAKVFDFATVFFQPSPIISFGVESAVPGDFDVYAVEQKPIVQLNITAASVYQEVTMEQIIIASTSASAVRAPTGSYTPVGASPDHAAQLAKSTASGIAQGAGHMESHDEEAHDEVPALRSARQTSEVGVASGDISPPSPPTHGLLLSTSSNSSSTASSASNSRLQSPGSVHRPDFPIDQPLDTTQADLIAGRSSSPSTNSPIRPILRPRGNSTDGRVQQFHLAPASSQPTPASTPAPGTPSQFALRPGMSTPLNDVASPLPSPLPSPRGGPATAQISSPPSPLQQTNGVDMSAAQSPLSSPSSPLTSPSPQLAMDDSQLQSIPNTPLHTGANSSTITPAPTPMALGGASTGRMKLSQMSTAEVSLQFLSATGVDVSRLVSGSGAPTATPSNTPLPTPASSVPSTPRLVGVQGGTANIARKVANNTPNQQQSLRVRTSGSTSPSPISSPMLNPHSGYIKARSASMDRSDMSLHAARLGVDVLAEEDEGTLAAGSDAERPTPVPSSRPSPSSSSSLSGKEKQENTLLLRLDQLFSRHFGKLSGLMTQERMESNAAERARFDALTADLVQTISDKVETQVRDSISAVVESTLTDIILPNMEQSITHAVQAASSSIASGSAVGGGSSVSSSVDPEALSTSILHNLRSPLQDSFRQAFAQTLLPSFQQSINAMLTQVRQSVVAAAVPTQPAVDEAAARDAKRKADEEKRRLFAASEAAQREKARDAEMKRLSTQMDQVLTLLATIGTSQQQALAAQQLLATQVAAVRPASLNTAVGSAPSALPPPPTPTSVDITTEVAQLIAAEQFDAAFTKALTSSKLAVVMFACSQVDPRVLLSTSVSAHRLSSPVFLSLISQLGHDLSPSDAAQFKLKMLWLRESAMVLNITEPNLRPHVAPMLKELLNKLELIQLPTTHEMFDQLRMVRMIVQSKLATL